MEINGTAAVGEQSERDHLMMVVYDELRRIAGAYMGRERSNHTLQPTALVHEAYLRLAAQDRVIWKSREHFIGVAATIMRRILVDYARAHKRDKRGGGNYRLSLTEAGRFAAGECIDLESLDEALNKLADLYPQKSEVVELRVFGGLTVEETARVMGISDRTVKRDWRFARAWLLNEMEDNRG
jgi:RNA polymerase sigma factor (TIGR02999 family)